MSLNLCQAGKHFTCRHVSVHLLWRPFMSETSFSHPYLGAIMPTGPDAQLRFVELILNPTSSLLTSFSVLCSQEAEVFAAAVVSDNAKGLVNVFFAQRASIKVSVSNTLSL